MRPDERKGWDQWHTKKRGWRNDAFAFGNHNGNTRFWKKVQLVPRLKLTSDLPHKKADSVANCFQIWPLSLIRCYISWLTNPDSRALIKLTRTVPKFGAIPIDDAVYQHTCTQLGRTQATSVGIAPNLSTTTKLRHCTCTVCNQCVGLNLRAIHYKTCLFVR